MLYAPDGHLMGVFATGEESARHAAEAGSRRHAECYATHPLIGFIDEITVRRGKRGKGTGSRLLKTALARFKEIRISAVYLKAVPERPEWLIRLLRFYWHFGFEIVPECIEEEDTAITMRAILEP